MMHCLGGRRSLELPHRCLVGEDSFEKLLQINIRHPADNRHELGEHFVHRKTRHRKVMGWIDLMILASAYSVDGKLQMVAIGIDHAPNQDDVVAIEGVDAV